MALKIVILGGGDLASGIALRLFRTGCRLVMTELATPYAVRRSVSFAQAVFDGSIEIEGVTGTITAGLSSIEETQNAGEIPVMVDPDATVIQYFHPDILIDARMTKVINDSEYYGRIFTIGLGPGFKVGSNCDVVIETKRGHFMGRAIYAGTAEDDTGIPDQVANFQKERVLRSPAEGIFHTVVEIGQILKENDLIGQIDEVQIHAPFTGMLRGLLHDGLQVKKGIKIGDIDPRTDPRLYLQVSDKALAVGGGVLEAILSRPELKQKMCG